MSDEELLEAKFLMMRPGNTQENPILIIDHENPIVIDDDDEKEEGEEEDVSMLSPGISNSQLMECANMNSVMIMRRGRRKTMTPITTMIFIAET